jgi:hypothetical protein
VLARRLKTISGCVRWVGAIVVAAAILMGGCVKAAPRTVTIAAACSESKNAKIEYSQAQQLLLGAIKPCLQKDGRFDYQKLINTPEIIQSLNCYLEFVGRANPESQPQIFSDPAGRTAFYLNAYAGYVLRGAAEFYPIKRLSKCPVDFNRGVIFTVAGQAMTLEQLAQECGRGRDWRIDFALPSPTLSGPYFRPVLYSAEGLEEQLNTAVRDYISSCAGVQIDHAGQKVLFGRILWQDREIFVRHYTRQFHMAEVDVISAVTPWAWPETQKWLADVPGYQAGQMRDNDSLNDIPRKKDSQEPQDESEFLPCGCR